MTLHDHLELCECGEVIAAALLEDGLHLSDHMADIRIEPAGVKSHLTGFLPFSVADGITIFLSILPGKVHGLAFVLEVADLLAILIYLDRDHMIVLSVYICVSVDSIWLITVTQAVHQLIYEIKSHLGCHSVGL